MCQTLVTTPMRLKPRTPKIAAIPNTHFMSYLSKSRPNTGMDKADTTMNTVAAPDRVVRETLKSSLIGIKRNPNKNLEPPLKNNIKNAIAKIAQRLSILFKYILSYYATWFAKMNIPTIKRGITKLRTVFL